MNNSQHQPNIVVVGSSSIDLVLSTSHIPKHNETVIADKAESFFGGKGANQAVAASRLGASVSFVGCVGKDSFGQKILQNLIDEKVNIECVFESEDAPTGTAYVTSSEGVNSIVVVPASNYSLEPSHVLKAEKFFDDANLVLIQQEIPMETVEFTVDLAKKNGTKIGLYASPARKLSAEIVDACAFIVAKSSELSIVFEDEKREDILRKYAN